jgi:aryl sulfotransferase
MSGARAEGPGPIVWLSSYPRSGNTWLRAMLTAYCDPGEAEREPVALDALIGGAVLNDRRAFDDEMGFESCVLTLAELDGPRGAFHTIAAADATRPFFVKTHDRFRCAPDGSPLFPIEASAGALYLVRDPRDVAVSFAAHEGVTIDAMIARMADCGAGLDLWGDRASPFLPQWLGSWSEHVDSWLSQRTLPLLMLRYEDMVADAAGALARVVAFAGLAHDSRRIAEATRRASFDALREGERVHGFREKPAVSARFFRKGVANGWRTELSGAQADLIVGSHAATMRRLGYQT